MPDRYAERDYVENSGSGNVFIQNYGAADTPVAVLEPLQPPPANVASLRATPSALLDVRRRVVPMVGRQSMLADFATWRDTPEIAAAVRLYYGPGGRGKTRLALQAGDDAIPAGWKVWAARQVSDAETICADRTELVNDDSAAGHLVTIDYAERWPAQLLCAFIARLAEHCGDRPLRVMLLARHGSWWAPVRSALTALEKVHIDAGNALELTPLAQKGADRKRLFRTACLAFANTTTYLGTVEPNDIDPPDDFDTHATYNLPLTILMEALAAVDARSQRQSRPAPEDLSRYLLDREMRLWQQAIEPNKLARTAYCATLVGEQPFGIASKVLAAACAISGPTALEHLLSEHGEFYPPTPGRMLAPLVPDRLGEDFLALTTPGDVDTPERIAEFASPGMAAWTRSAYPSPGTAPSSTGWLATIVSDESGSTIQTARAITVLAEAATNWPHLTEHINSLLQAVPDIALSAGNATLTALSQLPGIANEALEAVVGAQPPQSDPNLDLGLADITQQWALRQLPEATNEAKATIHNKLGYRLYCVGRYEEALTSSRHAATLYEQLNQSDGHKHLPELAATFVNHCAYLATVGQDAEMLTTNQQAIDIYTSLCEHDEPKYSPALAKALQNQSSVMADQRRAAEALAASQRAVNALTNIGTEDSHTLAAVLSQHSSNLGHAGQYAVALTIGQEAVNVMLRSPDDGSFQHQDTLATVLGVHSENLAQAGHLDEALNTGQRAIDIRTNHASIIPERYNQALSQLLATHGGQLFQAGHVDQALSSIQRAIDLFTQRADRNTQHVQVYLARAQHTHSEWLSHARRHGEALKTVQSAIETRTQIATIDSSHRPDLAQSLTLYSFQLLTVGRSADAVSVSQRAIDLWQQLARDQPGRYIPELTQSLHNHAVMQQQVGQLDAAVQTCQQAVDLRITLANGNLIYLPHLVDSLRNLAGHLESLGRSNEALDMKQRADSFEAVLVTLDDE